MRAAGPFLGMKRLQKKRPGVIQHQGAQRQQEKYRAQDVDPGLDARPATIAQEIDAHMLVFQQGVGRRQQEHRREQAPLDFQQAVGTHVEDLAHDGVAGADQHRDQDQPRGTTTDGLVQTVDQLCELQ